MRLIGKIAKNEWYYLVYSPIAWFALLVFWVLIATAYSNAVYDMANLQEIMLKNSSPRWTFYPDALTGKVFVGLYATAISYLYLFIPLLTMGLISREKNGSTIRLLYASPISIRQIVLGKYLGIVLYLALLVAVVIVFMIVGAFNIVNVDYGLFISGFLGFYLLVCAYAAIGLFMSALANYTIISAMGVFVIIFMLDRIGSVWQRYDVLRDITWFLSLRTRTQQMMNGLVVSRDIVYFIAIAAMFVSFTIIKLRSEQYSRPWYITAFKYLSVVFVIVTLGYICSRPSFTKYWDLTARKSNTIPIETQQLINELGDSSLEVTLYTNLLSIATISKNGLPEYRNPVYLNAFWEPYSRFKPDIKFSYEYYYDIDPNTTDSFWYRKYPDKTLQQIAAKVAQQNELDLAMFKTPEQMHQIIDLKPESYGMVMQLKYKGRKEILRTMEDPQCWPGPSQVSSVLKRLLHPETISNVYFLRGEFERDIQIKGDLGYAEHVGKGFRNSIANMGLNIDTVNLNMQDLPKDMDVLVVASPVMEMSSVVQNKIKMYIDQGGNMLVLGKPGKQYIINPLLKYIGVQLMDGQIVQPSFDETPEKVVALSTRQGKNLSFETETIYGVGMPNVTGVVTLPDTSFLIEPLLKTTPGKTWLKAGELIIDSTLPPVNVLAGDRIEKDFTTAFQLSRNIRHRQQRIVVIASADFISNLRLQNSLWFIRGTYSWLTNNHYPIQLSSHEPKDILLTISEKTAYTQKVLFVWILSGCLLVSGIIVLTKRKRP